MSLTIELTPAEEERLRSAARQKGVPPEELARQLIANLPTVDVGSDRVTDELREMGRRALREHASGRTEDFPA